MGIIITDKTDNKKKYRRSYEDYISLETQPTELTGEPATESAETEPGEPTEAEN